MEYSTFNVDKILPIEAPNFLSAAPFNYESTGSGLASNIRGGGKEKRKSKMRRTKKRKMRRTRKRKYDIKIRKYGIKMGGNGNTSDTLGVLGGVLKSAIEKLIDQETTEFFIKYKYVDDDNNIKKGISDIDELINENKKIKDENLRKTIDGFLNRVKLFLENYNFEKGEHDEYNKSSAHGKNFTDIIKRLTKSEKKTKLNFTQMSIEIKKKDSGYDVNYIIY